MNDISGDITTVSRVGQGSLRTVIPATICRQFGIVDGSSLSWKITIVDGELKMVVCPVETATPGDDH